MEKLCFGKLAGRGAKGSTWRENAFEIGTADRDSTLQNEKTAGTADPTVER